MQNSILLENITREELFSEINEIVTRAIESRIKPEIPKDYLTKKETAQLLRLSLPTLQRLTNSGKIKAYRIGRRVLYQSDEVTEALKSIETLKYKRN